MNIYIALFTFIGIGTTVIIAQSIVAENIDKANEVVKKSVILSIIIGILLEAISLVFSGRIFIFLWGNTGGFKIRYSSF